MTGIVIVLISVVAAAYLIIKKFYAPGALLLVGLITLAVVAVISPDPLVTGKKATHLAGLDVIQIMTNLLQSRAAGRGEYGRRHKHAQKADQQYQPFFLTPVLSFFLIHILLIYFLSYF